MRNRQKYHWSISLIFQKSSAKCHNTRIIYIISKMQEENEQSKSRWYSSFGSIKRNKSFNKKIPTHSPFCFHQINKKRENFFKKFQHHINKLSCYTSKYECLYKFCLIMFCRILCGMTNTNISMDAKVSPWVIRDTKSIARFLTMVATAIFCFSRASNTNLETDFSTNTTCGRKAAIRLARLRRYSFSWSTTCPKWTYFPSIRWNSKENWTINK